MKLRAATAFGYVLLLSLWIYVGHTNDVAAIALFFAVGAGAFLSGIVIGRWWTMLLPPFAIPISIPADWDPDFPVWFDIALFIAPPAVFLAALGVGARKAASRSARIRH